MKISFNFLDRWEYAIFKQYNEAHAPVSKSAAGYAFYAAAAAIIIVFALQIFSVEEYSAIILGIIGVITLLLVVRKTYKQLTLLSSTGSKIGYGVYILTLFLITLFVSFYLVMWALIIAICLFIAYFILVYGIGDGNSSGKKRFRKHYSDGSSEEFEEDGRGILGETHFKGDRGNTHIE